MIRLCTYFLLKVVDVSITFVWDVTGKINEISFACDSSISFPTSDVLRITKYRESTESHVSETDPAARHGCVRVSILL